MSQIKVKQNYLACLAGTVVMVGLSVLAVLIFPIFILNEYLPTEYTKALVVILMGVTAFVGALVAGLLAEDGGGWIQLLSGGIYCILWMFVAIFGFDGVTMGALYGVIACCVGCVAASVVLNKEKKPHAKRKKWKRYR